MTYWIKRIAAMLSIGAFFLGFFMSIDPSDPFDAATIILAAIKGGAGALLFWAAGFVVADIIIKGLVSDLHTDQDDIVEGGLLQRLYTAQLQQSPEAEASATGSAPTIQVPVRPPAVKRK